MLIKKRLKTKTFEEPCSIPTSSLYGIRNVRPKIKNQEALASQLTLKKFEKKKQVRYIKTKKKLLKYKETPFFSWVLNNLRTTGEWKKEPSRTFMDSVLKKNKKKLQLQIVLKSYGGSSKQAADIQLSLDVISKLIDYLNYFCTKRFKNIIYSRKEKYKYYFDTSSLASTTFNELFISYSTTNLTNQVFSLQKQKEEKYSFDPLIFDLQSKDQALFLCAGVLQKRNYANRYFFKWCELFANNSSINKQIHKPLHSTKLFTVVRSPFVFKKTREQFSSQKLSYSILAKLQNPMQKLFLIQSLGLLRLPCELDILDY